MIIVNKFDEQFNYNLTDNTLGIVVFRKFHLGIDIHRRSANITLQGFGKIILITLCFSRKRYKYLKDER